MGSFQSQSDRNWLTAEAGSGALPDGLLATHSYQWCHGAREAFRKRLTSFI